MSIYSLRDAQLPLFRTGSVYGMLWLISMASTPIKVGSIFDGRLIVAGQRIIDRNLNVQPTLTIRPGHPLRVVLTRDLVLEPIGATR